MQTESDDEYLARKEWWPYFQRNIESRAGWDEDSGLLIDPMTGDKYTPDDALEIQLARDGKDRKDR